MSTADQTLERQSVERPTITAAALAGIIDRIAAFVSSFEPGCYSTDDAASLVKLGARGERLCGAIKTLAATRAADANCHQLTGHSSAAHWLAGVTGESVGDAVDTLRLGAQLGDQPGIDDAFRSGKLSKTRASVIAGAVAVNPRSEGELLRAGSGSDTLRQLKDRCLRAKAQGRSETDEAKHNEALHRARSCRTWSDRDGAFRLDARLTPDAGASLLAALRAESDRVFDVARKAGVHESSDAYAADALVALVTGKGIRAAEPVRVPARSGSEASNGDGSDDPAPTPRIPDPKAIVHLRVDLDALRNGSIVEGQTCEIAGVGTVSIEHARKLMGDAIFELVIANGVDVTTVCHLGRSIRKSLKMALLERDRTCVVPGCDRTQGLEIDHRIIAYADGGEASMANLARLCHHHHYLRTHQGFALLGEPGNWQWVPPKRSGNSDPPPPPDPNPPLFPNTE